MEKIDQFIIEYWHDDGWYVQSALMPEPQKMLGSITNVVATVRDGSPISRDMVVVLRRKDVKMADIVLHKPA